MERHSIAVPGWWLNAWFDPIGLQSGCNLSAINLNLIRNQDAINLWMHRIQIWKRCFHLCSFFVLKLDWPEVWFYCNSSSADSWATVCLVKWQIKSKKRLRSTYFRERCGKIWCRKLLFVVTFVQMLWWQQAGCSFYMRVCRAPQIQVSVVLSIFWHLGLANCSWDHPDSMDIFKWDI